MRRMGLIAIATLALIAARATGTNSPKNSATSTRITRPPRRRPRRRRPRQRAPTSSVRFGDASGYLALPASAEAKKPAIIVIQEWWGVDDWVREQTERFAEQGYVALAPDLYRGTHNELAGRSARARRAGLPEDRAMADLKAAVDYLATRADVDPNRIGVIGWCMGGGYALKLATAEPRAEGHGRQLRQPRHRPRGDHAHHRPGPRQLRRARTAAFRPRT